MRHAISCSIVHSVPRQHPRAMPFANVPPESKSQINKAGKMLARLDQPGSSPDGIAQAWDLTSRWRVCHGYPINTFQATLRTKLKNNYPQASQAAQRLKRMPTIIDKLRRYPAMQLTTMQDIAGLRAILPTVTQAEALAAEYRASRFTHQLQTERDYIGSPRDEDGYRSIHLIYRYENKRNPSYDGLRVELQIRSQLQHMWATAVETMGTFLGQALKSRQGDEAWIHFFSIVSAAFAHIEKRPVSAQFCNLTLQDIHHEIARAEATLNALELMRGFSVATESIPQVAGMRGYYYHLIVLDSEQRNVRVRPFRRDDFEAAVLEWERIEKRVTEGERLEPVLVAAGTLHDTKRAYPNFFLDMRTFRQKIRAMIKHVDLRSVTQP